MKPASETLKKPDPLERKIIAPEDIAEMRASMFYRDNPVVSARYEIGAHSGTKATCRFCHGGGAKNANLKPGVGVCADCHKTQVTTFVKGRHGAPDGVEGGWLYGAAPKMGCGACHDAHSLRVENAGKAACLNCHKNTHALSHSKSGHNRYLTDPVFEGKPMAGADCATCHMPRLAELGGHTDHDETLSSSSKERMALTVCSLCHGLKFALMALHDADTVRSNFTTAPMRTPVGVEYLEKAGE
jgi:formate-dependent nitrite reductase cytochrome c552 subunit